MNLEDLRAVQVDERSTDTLQSLPSSFYQDAAAYLEDLREKRERVAATQSDPFASADVRELSDELETAEDVVEAIYERRIGKLVKLASLRAAGMSVSDDAFTGLEADLFTDLVTVIEESRHTFRQTVLQESARNESTGEPSPHQDDTGADANNASENPIPQQPDGGGPDLLPESETEQTPRSLEPDPSGPLTTESNPPDGQSTQDQSTTGEDPASTVDDPPPAIDRVTVRITRDIGEIFGVDENVYHLRNEDVVTLPAENAKPLLDRDAAQRVD